MNPPPPGPTLVACLTPPGTAAIATLALRGPKAWDIVREAFRPRSGKELPREPEAGRTWLGRLGEDPQGPMADEVLFAVRKATAIPWIELHCHGGQEVIRYLLEVVTARGARACSWQELERRTGTDPLRVEALAALVQARTPRTAGILLDQYQDAFGRAVAEARQALQAGRGPEARSVLAGLVRYGGLGRHLTAPWRVVIAGAPNVGKSSLVNALAGYPRCVVAPTPGTTRDVVTTLIAVGGWPVELADTAGLREGAGALEAEGIGRAARAVREADLCLWLLDASGPPAWPPVSADSLRLVVNKTDLPAAWDHSSLPDGVSVSARTGAGLDGLCGALARWLVPDPPPPGAAVPFTPALVERVELAYRACSAGQDREALHTLHGILE